MKKILSLCFSLLLAAGICTACDDENQPPVATPPSLLTLTTAEGYHAESFIVKVGTTRYDISPSLKFKADNTFNIEVGYGEAATTTSQASVKAEGQNVRARLTSEGTFTYDEETGVLVLTPYVIAPTEEQQASLLAEEAAAPEEGETTAPRSYTFTLVRNILGEYVLTGNFGTYAHEQFDIDDLSSVPSALVLVLGALTY